jgi:hypothetical protein
VRIDRPAALAGTTVRGNVNPAVTVAELDSGGFAVP